MRMNNTIIIMSCMGSACFLLGEILIFIGREKFTEKEKYGFLKLSLIFFLFPFPQLAPWIQGIMPDKIIEHIAPVKASSGIIKLDPHMRISVYSDGKIVLSSGYQYLLIVGIVWAIILLILIIRELQRYYALQKKLRLTRRVPVTQELDEMIESYKKEMHIKRKITVYILSGSEGPFTVGVFRPSIYVPEESEWKDSNTCIIKHEFYHIKRYDFLFKILALLVIAVHWFNPVVYLMFFAFTLRAECACDEQIIQSMDKSEILKYGNLVLDYTAAPREQKQYRLMPVNGFGNDSKKVMKERIKVMKRGQKGNRKRTVIARVGIGLLAVCFMYVSSLPLMAYEMPQVAEADYPSTEEVGGTESNGASEEWVPEEDMEEYMANEKLPDDGIQTDLDEYFIDEEGNVYSTEESSVTSKKRANCKHTYKKGTLVKHKKNESGGCTKTYYDCKRCSRCGKIVDKVQTRIVVLKKCTH